MGYRLSFSRLQLWLQPQPRPPGWCSSMTVDRAKGCMLKAYRLTYLESDSKSVNLHSISDAESWSVHCRMWWKSLRVGIDIEVWENERGAYWSERAKNIFVRCFYIFLRYRFVAVVYIWIELLDKLYLALDVRVCGVPLLVFEVGPYRTYIRSKPPHCINSPMVHSCYLVFLILTPFTPKSDSCFLVKVLFLQEGKIWGTKSECLL